MFSHQSLAEKWLFFVFLIKKCLSSWGELGIACNFHISMDLVYSGSCARKSIVAGELRGICNTSHKFWDLSPVPHYQCCLQVSETGSWHKLRRCYSSSVLQYWVGARWQFYFWKVDHSRISINFSRNCLGLNNLCQILSQNLRKLGKWNW